MNTKKLIRQAFRDAVFRRDRFTCKFCNVKQDLDAHHITDRSLMPNGGYVKQNGITLCPQHHLEAELFHITEGREWTPGMHPDDLYKMIGSSHTLAVEAARRG